jgi:1,4-alpha-glucan branching enzyme
VDNENYYYADLNRFDRDMIHLLSGVEGKPLIDRPAEVLWDKEGDQVHAFRRGNLVFVFNWNGQRSFFDYGILAPEGKYEVLLNTDNPRYAGFGLADDTVEHFTQPDPLYAADRKGWLKLYLPARSAVVLKKV